MKGLLVVIGLSAFICGSAPAAEPSTPLLKEHCFRYHGEAGKVKGKVNLLERATNDDFLSHPTAPPINTTASPSSPPAAAEAGSRPVTTSTVPKAHRSPTSGSPKPNPSASTSPASPTAQA